MQPVTDLYFLAEASPRALATSPTVHVKPEQIASTNTDDFIETVVRCMGYRSYIRWYHGSFSTSGRVSRLVLNYILALLVLVALYAFMCVTVTTNGSDPNHDDDDVFGLPTWLAISSLVAALVTILMFLGCEQTPRVAPISTWLSRLTIIAVFIASLIQFIKYAYFVNGRPTFSECPTMYPTFVFPITLVMLVSIQLLLAVIACCIQLLAIPVGRWYLLRSDLYKSSWQANIVDIQRSTVTILACPFNGCQGEWNFRKRLSAIWNVLAHGRRVVFSPVEGYLPYEVPINPADVRPCCPFACVYVGQVDHQLRPHGTGVWQQGWGARFGEYLSGTWEFGRPIAPFMSRQNVCGSGFTALRFGWVKFDFTTQDSIDQVFKGKKLQSDEERLEEANFEFGLLDVECSVFGNFFRRFPKYIYWKFPNNVNLRDSLTPRGFGDDQDVSAAPLPQLRRRTSRLKPAPGLNNRMSSFSYLEAEPAARSSFLSTHQPSMQPPLSPRRNTLITEAKESFSFASRMIAHKASVDRRRSSQRSRSSSKCRTLEGRQELPGTFEDCYIRMKWVVDNMLPYHIPICAGEEQETKTLKITLDPSRGLTPNGWCPNATNRTSWRATRMSRVVESPKQSRTWCGYVSPPTATLKEAPSGGILPPTELSSNESVSSGWMVSSLHVELAEARRNRGTNGPVPTPDALSPTDNLEIAVAGWRRAESDLEAMVFIHGYKTPLEEAPLLLGQLIALGGFPNRIKPFMFLWPAGVKMWHYYQARRASHHYLCQKALVFFLKTLAHRGVRSIHILAHSMGSRLFLNALKYAEQEHLFLSNSSKRRLAMEGPPPQGTLEGQLDLVNLVFLHPEYYLEDFVDGGGYDACKKCASLITVYCHANDEALASAEILSRGQRCMGRHPFGFVRPFNLRPGRPASILKKPSPLYTSGSSSSSLRGESLGVFSPRSISPRPITVSDEFMGRMTTSANSPRVRRVNNIDSISRAGSSPRCAGPGSPRMLSRNSSLSDLVEDRFRPQKQPRSKGEPMVTNLPWEWLDLDVIDCTFLDANVHGLRHCFFNINASVVGDLRELLTQRNRAAQRHQTLERRDGNVYTFRTPPAELSSIFGV